MKTCCETGKLVEEMSAVERLGCHHDHCVGPKELEKNMDTTTDYEETPPYDWQNPEWDNESRVHNWRNYVSGEIQSIWDTLTDVQKKALAISYDGIASQEDWE